LPTERGLEDAHLGLDDFKLLGVEVIQPRLQNQAEDALLVLVLGVAVLAVAAQPPPQHADEAGLDLRRLYLLDIDAVAGPAIGARRQHVPLNAQFVLIRQDATGRQWPAAAGCQNANLPWLDDRVRLHEGLVDDGHDKVPALALDLALNTLVAGLRQH